MTRMSIYILLVLAAMLFFCGQAESVRISVESRIPWYTDDLQLNISGSLMESSSYWFDYDKEDFDNGTAHNISVSDGYMRLTPGLEVKELNGGDPVFKGTSTTSWDTYVHQFDVVELNGTYYMYYSGSNTTSTNSTWHIGLATSTDGLNWTRYASNPILKAGVDSYDYYGLTDPTVLVANGTWYIWYGGNQNGTSLDIDICYATSTDGYNWSKYASNPILRNNDNNSVWNGIAVRPQSITIMNGTFNLYYSGMGTTNKTNLGVMTSINGKNWTDSWRNPLHTYVRNWMKNGALYGTVEEYNGYYRMWVCGNGDKGWQVGYIVSYNGVTWYNTSKPVLSPEANSSYSSHIRWPVVLAEDGAFTMYAQGVDDNGVGTYLAFRVNPIRMNGTFTSDLKDLGGVATIDQGYWNLDTSDTGEVLIRVRYGNSIDSLSTWINITGRNVTDRNILRGVNCRYMQYRIEFSSERDWLMSPAFYYIYWFYYSPVASFAYSFDEGPYQNVTLVNKTWRFTLSLDEGLHSLVLYAEDMAGSSDMRYYEIFCDRTPPTGDILIEWGANASADTTVDVLLMANDTYLPIFGYLSDRKDMMEADRWVVDRSTTAKWAFPNDAVGEVTLYVQYVDLAGRKSPIYNDAILLDRSPPEATLVIDGGAGYTNSTTVTLTLNWTDESPIFFMWVSNEPVTTYLDWILPVTELDWVLPEGEWNKTVYVRLMDEVGWTTNLSAEITLDQTDPVASLVVNEGEEFTSDTRVQLYYTITDDGPFQVRFGNLGEAWPDVWNNMSSTWDVPWSLMEGEDGRRVARMMVMDAAGNIMVVSDDIVLDTTPPGGTLTLHDGTNLTGQQNVRVRIFATDETSGLHMMIVSNSFAFPDHQWQKFDVDFSWPLLLGDGDKRVYVMLRDRAGMTSIIQAGIVLDMTAPTGTVAIGDGSGYSLDPLVTLHLDMEDEYGPAEARTSLSPSMEDSDWVAYSKTLERVLPNREGQHTVHVQVRDKVGNILQTEVTVFLDLTDPTVSVTIAEGAVVTLERFLEVRWSVADGNGLAGVRFAYEPTFSGIVWEHPFETGTKEHTGLAEMMVAAEGERHFYVQVIDLSGRVATATDTIWYVRDRPLGHLVLGDGSGWTDRTDLSVAAEWTGGSEATHFRVALSEEGLDQSDWHPISEAASIELQRRAGSHLVYAQLKETHGVTSLSFSSTVTLDLSPPLILILTPTKRTTEDPSARLTLNVVEDLDRYPSVRWRVNGGAWNAYADEARVDLRVGMNVIEVECVDAAGNTGTSVWTMEREEATGIPSIALVAVGVVVALALVAVVIYWTRLSKE